MSRYMVGIALDALLDDEELRVRFAIDPIDALVDLAIRGISLTPEEIEAFMRIGAHLWSWTDDVVAGRIH